MGPQHDPTDPHINPSVAERLRRNASDAGDIREWAAGDAGGANNDGWRRGWWVLMARIMGIILTMLAMMPSIGMAQERAPMGMNVCGEENPGDLAGRNACYAEWRRSGLLVRRYYETYVEDGTFWDGFSSALFRNPYKLNRRNLFGNCSAGQVFSGNFWDNQFDFREVWACIARHDKEAAKWDMI